MLAKADTVFGTLETTEERVDLRSHGSLHEQLVPLIGYGGPSRTDWIEVWIEGEWTTALWTEKSARGETLQRELQGPLKLPREAFDSERKV